MAAVTSDVVTLRARPRAEAPRSAKVIGWTAPRWFTPCFLASTDAAALGLAIAIVALAGHGSAVAFAFVPLALFCLAVSGAYRTRITLGALSAAPWLATRLAVPLLLLAPASWLGANVGDLLTIGLVAVATVIPTRVLSFGVLRHARRRPAFQERAVILGAGEVGTDLAQAFEDFPEFGITPVGFVDRVGGEDLVLPVLGDVDELAGIITAWEVRRVFVAFGPARESALVGVLRTAAECRVDLHVVPRFFDCGVTPEGPDTDDVRGIPVYRVRRAALRRPAWVMKRVLDVAVAGTVLVLTAPIQAVVALAVKLTSPGPVLFRQQRVGQRGQTIEVAKFRSLACNGDSDTRWNVNGDPGVTKVGRVLRATSLDELPQLWSIVKGDMSLVGPRPERPFFVERFSQSIDGYDDRHRLPVGLTGWAQVHGLRGDTSIEERARYDNQYIEHWSLWRDIVILVRTVAEVVRSARR